MHLSGYVNDFISRGEERGSGCALGEFVMVSLGGLRFSRAAQRQWFQVRPCWLAGQAARGRVEADVGLPEGLQDSL